MLSKRQVSRAPRSRPRHSTRRPRACIVGRMIGLSSG